MRPVLGQPRSRQRGGLDRLVTASASGRRKDPAGAASGHLHTGPNTAEREPD
jgi:hypothetical protein